MNSHSLYDGEEEDDEEEEDDDIDEDIEAVRRACMITGANPDKIVGARGFGEGGGGKNQPDSARVDGGGGGGASWDSDSEDDLEMLRSIKNRFALSVDVCEVLKLKPLAVLPPVSFSDDDEEDDFETLRAIRRRFSAYESYDKQGNFVDDLSGKQEQVHASGIASDNETSNDILSRANTCESFPDSQQSCVTVPDSEEACNAGHLVEVTKNTANQHLDQPDTCESSLVPVGRSSFPESAQAFVDAIRRNRSYQRFLRSKLTEIEATIEENKKLRERVKILKDFQASCKRITRQALSQKKDPCVLLISAQKSGPSDSWEGNDKKISPMLFGPLENPRVANSRMALTKYPISVERRSWSTEENESLAKGLKQQVQERLLYETIDQFSCSEGSINNLDIIVETIKDLEITPEMIRQFLPKVNWDQLASMYIKDRSGAECEARWLNWEDPLINCSSWTAEEDKNLLLVIQEKGITNWLDIAVSLGTGRTPFQCLARYQRSLNASMLKREWTKEEDDQLRAAVELFGERDWQAVASVLEGRAGTQCSNRWKKTLHPTRQRVGRWSSEEDKRLKVAVTLFGAKNWHKIAHFIPGRTPPQCRERWVNSLDPNVNRGQWTEDEDARLGAAVAEHGYSWSKVASHMLSRTDNQCWRRWKALNPHEVPLIQEARRLRREAFVGNFVDRESERPALCIGDLRPLPVITLAPEPENVTSTRKRKRKAKQELESDSEPDEPSNSSAKRRKSKRRRRSQERCSLQSSRSEDETVDESNPNPKRKKVAEQSSERKNSSQDMPKEKRRLRSHLGKNKCPSTGAEGIELGTSNCIGATFRGRNIEGKKNDTKKEQARRNGSAVESNEEHDCMHSEPQVEEASSTKPRLKAASQMRRIMDAGEKLGEYQRDVNTGISESEDSSWDISVADFLSGRHSDRLSRLRGHTGKNRCPATDAEGIEPGTSNCIGSTYGGRNVEGKKKGIRKRQARRNASIAESNGEHDCMHSEPRAGEASYTMPRSKKASAEERIMDEGGQSGEHLRNINTRISESGDREAGSWDISLADFLSGQHRKIGRK